MNTEDMFKLVGDLSHVELLTLSDCLEREINLSETVINEGFY